MKYFCLVSMVFLIIACNYCNFENPLPINKKNIYYFPGEFRGKWLNNSKDTVIISKHYLSYIEIHHKKLAKSLIDTSKKYIIKDKKIYFIEKGQNNSTELSKGYQYIIDKDSIIVNIPIKNEIILSKNSFLRKAGDYYLVNIKNENDWWFIILFERKKDKTIIIRSINPKNENDFFKNCELIHKINDDVYLNCNWNENEILKFINNGGFSDTLLVLSNTNKID